MNWLNNFSAHRREPRKDSPLDVFVTCLVILAAAAELAFAILGMTN